MKAEIRCVEKNAFRTVVEICHEMMIPSGMGEELQRQREMCIDPYTRVANRSKELVPMEVKTVLTLEKSGKRPARCNDNLQSGKGSQSPRCNADGSEYVYASGRFCL